MSRIVKLLYGMSAHGDVATCIQLACYVNAMAEFPPTFGE